MIPATFINGYKKAHPEASPAEIQDLYEKLLEVNPGIASMDAGELGAAVHGAVTHHMSNGGYVKKYADGGVVMGQDAMGVDEYGNPIPQVMISNPRPTSNIPMPMEINMGMPAPLPIDVAALTAMPQVNVGQEVPAVVPPQGRPVLGNPPVPQYDPFAGAGYDASKLMQQFDPEQVKKAYNTDALKAAYDDQDKRFSKNQKDLRNMSQSRLLGAMLGGSPEALTQGYAAQDKLIENQQAQNLLQTINKQAALLGFNIKQQEALQTAATAGLQAGKSVMEIAKDQQELFGKYGDNVVKGLGVEQQQRFNDPNSAETLSAKAAVSAQISSLPAEIQKEMRAVLSKPGVTAQELMPLMAQWLPAAYKSFADAAGIGKTAAETAGQTIKNANLEKQGEAYAEQQGTNPPNYKTAGVTPINTPSANAGSGGVSNAPTESALPETATATNMIIPPAVQAQRDRDRLAILQEELNNVTDPKDKAALQREILSTTKSIKDSQSKSEVPSASNSGAPAVRAPDTNGSVNFDKLKGAMSQPDNLDPAYVANAKAADLSPIQKLMRQRMESVDNAEIIALDKKIAKATGVPYIAAGSAPQTVMTPSGDGGFSTSVSPVSAAAMSRTGENIQSKANSVETFNASGRPAAQTAFRLADNTGYNKTANWTPNIDEDTSKLDLAINRLNAEAERFGNVVRGPSGAGTAAMAGAAAAINPLLGAAASAFGALNSSQPLTIKSPPEVIKQYALMTQIAAERQKLLIGRENAWSASHNGDTSGFVNSPEYKFVMNADPYINPVTGDVRIPLTRSQQDALLAQNNWGPFSSMSFTTPKGPIVGAPIGDAARKAQQPKGDNY